MIKSNSDGRVDGETGFWAATLRGAQGKILAAAKGRTKYNRIDMVELYGVLQGVRLAMMHGYVKLEASPDSL